MAEHQLPKLNTRVRFPSPAPPRRKFPEDVGAPQAGHLHRSENFLLLPTRQACRVGAPMGALSKDKRAAWGPQRDKVSAERTKFISGCSAVGSALGSGPRGRVFKSPHSDQHVRMALKMSGPRKRVPSIGQSHSSFSPRDRRAAWGPHIGPLKMSGPANGSPPSVRAILPSPHATGVKRGGPGKFSSPFHCKVLHVPCSGACRAFLCLKSEILKNHLA